MPEISVLMSVYNGERFIKESIDSILNQTFTDFEFIIINDGSTDKTREIIESYSDKRIRFFDFKKNVGVGAALNFGLLQASGKYYAKADSDDIYDRNRLLFQKNFLDSHPEISVVKTYIDYFPNDDNVLESSRYKILKNFYEKILNDADSPDEIQEQLYWFCCVVHSTIMARMEIIKRFGYSSYRIGEDYNLFYNINKNGYKFSSIKNIRTKIRVSKHSTTVNESSQINKILFEIKKAECQQLFNERNDVYIWGAGSYGEKVLNDFFKKNSFHVRAFIDSDRNKWGKHVGKLKVLPPKFLKEKDNKKIIVASELGKFEIIKMLKKEGYENLKDFVVL